MAHVTTFTFRALPGNGQAVIDHFAKWGVEQKPKATGFLHTAVIADNDDQDRFTAVVRFDSTENYQRNSDRSEIDSWYRSLRALLAEDPIWFNGTVVHELGA